MAVPSTEMLQEALAKLRHVPPASEQAIYDQILWPVDAIRIGTEPIMPIEVSAVWEHVPDVHPQAWKRVK